MARHNDLGKWGEDQAALYLTQQGYYIRARDWHDGKRDIDIIALTPDLLSVVFVEVKTRAGGALIAPEEAVGQTKRRNVGRAANAYIKQLQLDADVRFDIIAISRHSENDFSLQHIQDAFNPLL